MIVTADTHFTENPEHAYRWELFNHVKEACASCMDKEFWILGDLTDKKDRHPGALVNRLIEEFNALRDHGVYTHILMGNHDKPVAGYGTPYWQILNNVPGVKFYTQPVRVRDIMVLPFSDNPEDAWSELNWEGVQCIFMHQPVNGAKTESGRVVSGLSDCLGMLPRTVKGKARQNRKKVKIWSGDIHAQQCIGSLEYVGAPYPIDFGDDYDCRLLWLDDDDGEVVEEITLPAIKKASITLNSIGELQDYGLDMNDQAKIKYNVPPNEISQWPVIRDEIKSWCSANGVRLAGLEASVTFDVRRDDKAAKIIEVGNVFAEFCKQEGLPEETVKVGLSLMEKVAE